MFFAIYQSIIAITVCFSYVYGGQFCLSCSDAPDMGSCRQITQCKNEEVCFVHKYSNEKDQIRYDMGCSYPEICLKDELGHLFGKRSDHSHILCQQCCNDTHICNADLPCNGHFQDQVCLSCSGVETSKSCLRNISCNKEEVCYMHKYRTESGKLLHDFGCTPASLCVNTYSNTFGRRISEGRHLICEDCCHGTNLCNQNSTCNHFNQNSINGSCSTTNECVGNLLCLTGTCKCQSDEYYWTDSRCIPRKEANSHCKKSNECQESLQCISYSCQCIDTEYWNGSNCIKRKNYQQSCQLSTDCKKTLYCTHQHCNCDYNDYWTGHLCAYRKSEGVYCNSTDQCKYTLFCENNNCSCSRNYFWSTSKCIPKKSHNTTCRNSLECDEQLACMNNTCQCKQPFHWSGVKCVPYITECTYIDPLNPDGIYVIFPNGQPIRAYCIGPGRKWTVIQRRYNGSVDFDKNWIDYKYGFGSANGELWLGNEYIHLISNKRPHEISIKIVTSSHVIKYANYSTFKVSDESSSYALTLNGYSGDAGNAHIDYLDGQGFFTNDHDNLRKCGSQWNAGWWYNNCFHSNLNTKSGHTFKWDEAYFNLLESTMMIREK